MNDERYDFNNEKVETIMEDLRQILHQNLHEAEYFEEITSDEADTKYAAIADLIGMLWANKPEDLLKQLKE